MGSNLAAGDGLILLTISSLHGRSVPSPRPGPIPRELGPYSLCSEVLGCLSLERICEWYTHKSRGDRQTDMLYRYPDANNFQIESRPVNLELL